MFKARAEQAAAATTQPTRTVPAETRQNNGGLLGTILGSGSGSGARGREGAVEAFAKSAARAIGSEMGRRIIRGVLGSLLGGKRKLLGGALIYPIDLYI